jgi:antitoxin component YwqK of YwqJK toxin-antitoxin module
MRISLITLLIVQVLGLTSCQSHRNYSVPDVVDTTYVHKYGLEVPEKDWDKRGQHGQVVLKRKNGVTVTQNYVAGVLEGQSTHTFPQSDKVEKVLVFKSDILLSETENYPSGLPKERKEYNGDHTLMHSWYVSGVPKSIERIEEEILVEAKYFMPSNTVEAEVKEASGARMNRDPYGQVLSKDKIEEGKMVLRTLYHTNGMPKSLIPFKEDVVQGSQRNFLPTGEPESVEMWMNNQKQGITTLFENGEKIAEVPYVNGRKMGQEKRFKDGEDIVQIISWKNDVQHGPSVSYAGKTEQTDWYFDGRKVSKQIFQKMLRPVTG